MLHRLWILVPAVAGIVIDLCVLDLVGHVGIRSLGIFLRRIVYVDTENIFEKPFTGFVPPRGAEKRILEADVTLKL